MHRQYNTIENTIIVTSSQYIMTGFPKKIPILVSKYTPKRINHNMFSKISSGDIPHSNRVSKIFIFYIKNGNF